LWLQRSVCSSAEIPGRTTQLRRRSATRRLALMRMTPARYRQLRRERLPRRPKIPHSNYVKIADGDGSFVSSQLADKWVPQLSSKRPGVVETGWCGITPWHCRNTNSYGSVTRPGCCGRVTGRRSPMQTSGSLSRAFVFQIRRVRWRGAGTRGLIGTIASPSSSARRIRSLEARRTTTEPLSSSTTRGRWLPKVFEDSRFQFRRR
jgi:hypothetical protein